MLRKRGSSLFMDRWGQLTSAIAQAHVFPSTEEADFYWLNLCRQQGSYEICALKAGLPLSRKCGYAACATRRGASRSKAESEQIYSPPARCCLPRRKS
jgi:hypothetical protein